MDPLEDSWVRADRLQRRAFEHAARGDYQAALELSETACGAFMALSALSSVGKTLVDQAIFLGRLGRTDEAIQATLTAETYLSEPQIHSTFWRKIFKMQLDRTEG